MSMPVVEPLSGLIAQAFKRLSVERDMLATLDRGACARLATCRAVRAQRDALMPHGDVRGHHDAVPHAPSMPGAV